MRGSLPERAIKMPSFTKSLLCKCGVIAQKEAPQRRSSSDTSPCGRRDPDKVEALHQILTLLVGALASEVWTQQRPSADFIVFNCRRSLSQIYLTAENVLNKHVMFSAIDQFGRAFEINDALATQCGYTISHDFWGNIDFRASLLSCYTVIVDDGHFTVTVQIDIAPTPDMSGSVRYVKAVTCPYDWSPREILCETNYMEVSVRKKIPLIPEGILQDEPEDWSAAFPQAVSGLLSIWQVVFHLPSTRKAMLVSDAQNAGYGINTTESRILFRAPYNASEAQRQNVQGVVFSTVRSTIFYKQRWVILLVDTAVACPIDDVKYTEGVITWGVPKNISPLLVGASNIKNSRVKFGVNLSPLTDSEIRNRKYVVADSNQATIVTVPLGAYGGYYKTHVVNGEHGITYSINLLLENVWEDNRWGLTKHTIIKEIKTPFERRPPIIKNDTIPLTKIFNVTIGTFLPDVELVNLTIGPVTLPVQESVKLGYTIFSVTHPNGSVTFVLKVPFGAPNVKKEYVTDDIRDYILNVTFGFKVFPSNETFTYSTIITCPLPDAVLPVASGYCDQNNLNLVVIRGNVDTNWLPYVKNLPLTPETAQRQGFVFNANRTHFMLVVPRYSTSILYEVSNKMLMGTLPLTLKDGSTGLPMHDFSISCMDPKQPIDCLPNGTMAVTVTKITAVPNMDPSQLVLRDKRCKPASVTERSATFIFAASKCGTTRRFKQTTMTYENEISYFSPGMSDAAYKVKVACEYTINETLLLQYGFDDNPTPSAQTAYGSLALVMRLSKDMPYTDFYEVVEYPVVRYLRESLYFEVELLYSVDPRLELFLETCWATASSDRGSFPKWDVVVNSCEYSEDYKTIFHPVNADTRVKFPSHLKRFEVKMFTFVQEERAYLGEIYFHCSVVICNADQLSSDPLCTRACIPDRQRFGRSVDTNHNMHGYVSSGALLLESEAGTNLKQYGASLS
ncbi:uncharacterized protein LOC142492168 isoform X2 [Ascaphus truei]|uniref:uncharacterized protein LOC142492168 isoform X2 n=1 Tax=Ascaphus truei TaxID=8439 RepID=UPI003F59FE14